MLAGCKTAAAINHHSEQQMLGLYPTDHHYLTKLPNEVQYPAACCAMSDDVYMYGLSASSGLESMNHVNMPVRSVSAVDALNACILMIRLESKRHNQFRQEAWNCDTPLTPRGMMLMEEAYENVNVNEYSCEVKEMEDTFECTVSRHAANANVYSVTIPKVRYYGSQFGRCNCGVPQRDGKPCIHMIVLAKGGRINDPGFTRLSVMPHWYSTAIRRSQFPEDSVCCGNISMKSIKNKNPADDKLRYCPDWSAPRKSGHPKKDEKRKQGVMDAVARRRRKFLWCDICHKFNHNTCDCYKNEDNWSIADDAAPQALPVDDLNEDLTGTEMAVDGEEGVV